MTAGGDGGELHLAHRYLHRLHEQLTQRCKSVGDDSRAPAYRVEFTTDPPLGGVVTVVQGRGRDRLVVWVLYDRLVMAAVPDGVVLTRLPDRPTSMCHVSQTQRAIRFLEGYMGFLPG